MILGVCHRREVKTRLASLRNQALGLLSFPIVRWTTGQRNLRRSSLRPDRILNRYFFLQHGIPMFRLLTFVSLLSGTFVFTLTAETRGEGEKLPKVEIGKRGKAATAFVEVPKSGTGTAFCVHSSGFFVTTEHVVRGAGENDVTLVLNPSLENQKILKAKVVRVDKTSDLALLRVSDVADLASLPLGAVDGVAELAEVVACGFPLGKGLATDKKNYPAVSVNAGSVTSLRQKDSQLQSIQIDVALTYGNSGGPVLDQSGKVIGVVVSGRPGTGINQAVPVNLLDAFLKAPDVSFTAPELTRANLDKPVEFKAKVVSFMPKAPEPALELILQAGDQESAHVSNEKVERGLGGDGTSRCENSRSR